MFLAIGVATYFYLLLKYVNIVDASFSDWNRTG